MQFRYSDASDIAQFIAYAGASTWSVAAVADPENVARNISAALPGFSTEMAPIAVITRTEELVTVVSEPVPLKLIAVTAGQSDEQWSLLDRDRDSLITGQTRVLLVPHTELVRLRRLAPHFASVVAQWFIVDDGDEEPVF